MRKIKLKHFRIITTKKIIFCFIILLNSLFLWSEKEQKVIGDIAILILPFTTSKKIPLRNILFAEYKHELKNTCKKHSLLEQIYYKLFFSNIDEINYKNRIRLYKKN